MSDLIETLLRQVAEFSSGWRELLQEQLEQFKAAEPIGYESLHKDWPEKKGRWIRESRQSLEVFDKLLSLLSDRSALLWALLEEMAGEVVEVEDCLDGRFIRLRCGDVVQHSLDLKRLRQQLAELGDNAESTIDKLMGELEDARATLQRQSESHSNEVRLKLKYYQKTREQAKQIQRLEQLRQSRLHELLEAEARERGLKVALREDCKHPWWECFDSDGRFIAWQCTADFELETASDDVDPWDYALCVCLAALAEKRRREGEANNG